MCYGVFMMKLRKLIMLFITISGVAGSFSAAAESYTVTDGDSLEHGERRIRLDGIDAPEFNQVCYTANKQEYPCGADAQKYLENLLKDSEIRCDCSPEKDKYGREICECFADDISLNEALIFAGQAVAYRGDKYLAAEQEAKAYKRGIWRGKFMRPALYRALERLKSKNASDE